MNLRVNSRSSAPNRPITENVLYYILGLVLVLAAYGVNILLQPALNLNSPTLLFFSSIVLSAAFGGLRVGLVVTAAATGLSLHQSTMPDTAEMIRAGVFFLEGTLISYLVYRLRFLNLRSMRQLQENQERFDLALKNARISVYTNDLDLRYTWVYNPHPSFSPQQIIGRRDEDLLPQESVAELVALKRQVLGSGEGRHKHITATVSENTMTYAVTVEPMRDARGSVQGVLVATMDVTETVQARAALQEQEHFNQTVINTMPSVLYLFDLVNNNNEFVSAYTQEALGYSAEEVITAGENFLASVIHPDDKPAMRAHFERIGQDRSDESYSIQYRFRHRDGSWRWFMSRDTVFARDESGRPTQVLGIAHDITERKQAEEARIESERRFQRMADAAPAMLWVTNPAGECEFLSEAWYRFTGQTEATGLGFGWLDATHPDDHARAERVFLEANAAREHFALDYRLRRADGVYRWAIDSGQPHFSDDGEFLGYIGSVIDIHERKQAEQELQASEEKFRVALKNSPIIVAQVDRDLRYTWIYNPHSQFSAADIIGKRDDELNPDASIQQMITIKQQVLESGIGVRRRVTVYLDGERIVYDFTAEPLVDAQGEVVGVTTAALDVTEIERSQQALQESEELRRLALEAAGMGTWVNSVDGSLTVWDGQTRYIFGVREDEKASVSQGFSIIHEEDRELAQAAYAQAIAPNSSGEYQVEKRVVWADQSVHWVSTRGRVLYKTRDGKRHPDRLIGVVMDITERKQAENALRRSEERYRSLFNSIDQGFCICEMLFDQNGQPCDYRWIEVNPTFEDHTGLKDVIGKTALQLLPNLERHWIEIYGRVVTTGEPVRFEQGSDVMGRWFDVFAFPIGDPEDFQFALLFSDITQRRRAENVLRNSEARLQLARKAAGLGIYDYDIETGIIGWDEQLRSFWGVDTDEIITYDTFIAGVHPDDREHTQAAVDRAIDPAGDGVYYVEYRVINRLHGAVHWLLAIGQVSFEAGRPMRMIGTVQDISKRKAAETRSALLRTLAESLSRAMSAIEVNDVIIQHGIHASGAATGTIAVLDQDGENLKIIAAMGYPEWVIEKWHTIPIDHPTAPIALAMRQRRPLWIGSIEERQQIIGFTPNLSTEEKHEAWAVLPFNVNNDLIGVLGLGFDNRHEFDDAERAFLITMTDYCAQALERAQLTEQIRQLATVEERQRLSRELHDSVQQILFASSTRAELLPRIWDASPERARQFTQELIHLNRAALAEMRTLLLEMRPQAIVTASFSSLLDNLLNGLRGRSTVVGRLDYHGPPELYLPAETHLALYRLTQEALNNVVKHSQATQLVIECHYDDNQLHMEIRDNGRGFDLKRTSLGIGLNTMRERAQAVGAQLAIQSETGEGTAIIVDWTPSDSTP